MLLTCRMPFDTSFCRLYDVIHAEQQLTLVFEYLDQDLKKYLDASGGGGLQIYNIKVRSMRMMCSLFFLQ